MCQQASGKISLENSLFTTDNPENRGGTGSGMSFRVFGSVKLAERESAVAQAGATPASRGLD